jgi:hypothetical protein
MDSMPEKVDQLLVALDRVREMVKIIDSIHRIYRALDLYGSPAWKANEHRLEKTCYLKWMLFCVCCGSALNTFVRINIIMHCSMKKK